MQVIIPTAGLGTRLRPHTHTKAKPLVHVAGKPVLAYILDELKKIKVSEIIFIVGYMGDQIEKYVKENYKFKTKFVVQKELKGQAHAIKLAEEFIKEDVLIWFVDTLSNADIRKLKHVKEDGVIYVKKVEDPRRFGQHKVDKNGIVIENKEKADPPISDLVNIGLYYVKDYKKMFDGIDELIDKDIKTKGEFFLMDAFQLMMNHGTRFKALTVDVWEDCGKPETLLLTNQYLLKKMPKQKYTNVKNSMIIPPVFIDKTAKIENSIIGPFVSIDKGAEVSNSMVHNSILSEHCIVKDAQLKESLIGDYAKVKGSYKKLNVGDDSEVIFRNGDNT